MDLYQQLQDRPETLPIRYQRDGTEREATLVLDYGEQGFANLGITFTVGVYPSQSVGPLGALRKGAEESWEILTVTLKGFGLLFQGINLRKAVAGPVRIILTMGSAATSGFSFGIAHGLAYYFRLLCWLSIVLFIINLLPIPALDGGQILVFTLEVIRRKPLDPNVISRIQMIGFSFIVLLVVVVTFNDIFLLFGR
jgi:regulator of sigma E protease